MSKAMHLIANNVHSIGQSDTRCLPCSGVSGRVVALSPSSSCGYYNALSQVKIASQKSSPKGYSFACKANSSNGHRRNPDFSRQRNQAFSRNRNRPNEEKDGFELEESENLSSKNGPLLSNSYPHKYHATATPGPREREIVELFRKVQLQLRERAAIKEEKKIEALKGHGKECETVDSLLNLLRKHSTEQSKRKVKINGGGENREFWDQTEQNGSFNAEKNLSLFDSIRTPRNEGQETNGSAFSRPMSTFRKKSPVPQVNYQPIFPSKDTLNSTPYINSGGNRKNKSLVETRLLPELDREHDPETLQEQHKPEHEIEPNPNFLHKDEYDDDTSDDETSDIDTVCTDDEAQMHEPENQDRELSSMKLVELKALAKSHGLKGFSKLKKSELVELLAK